MHAWLPRLEAVDSNRREPQLGGLPFGFPAGRWPRCRRCRAPLTLLLQLPHDLPLIDLGGTGRMLYVFQCSDLDQQGCSAFAPDDGGSACFVLERAEQTDSVTAAPASDRAVANGWRLTRWERVEELGEAPVDLEEDDETGPSSQTKLGGAPFWIQEDETPRGPWRFLFQVDTDSFLRAEWAGIAGAGIASLFVRSDDVADARVVWQSS